MSDVKAPGAFVTYIKGRPALVIDDPRIATELASTIDLLNRGKVRRGLPVLLWAGQVVTPALEMANVATGVAMAQLGPTPEPPFAEGWITTQQAARALGVTDQAVTQAARKGSIAARKVAGRWWIDRKGVARHGHRVSLEQSGSL